MSQSSSLNIWWTSLATWGRALSCGRCTDDHLDRHFPHSFREFLKLTCVYGSGAGELAGAARSTALLLRSRSYLKDRVFFRKASKPTVLGGNGWGAPVQCFVGVADCRWWWSVTALFVECNGLELIFWKRHRKYILGRVYALIYLQQRSSENIPPTTT